MSSQQINLLHECPRCLFREMRQDVRRPKNPKQPVRLHGAVDHLLKKEFDLHRAAGSRHPLMAAHGVRAVPFRDPRMDVWRTYAEDGEDSGIRSRDPVTGMEVVGYVDDIWVDDDDGRLIVVDYKATARKPGARRFEPKVWDDWIRQAATYQWLLRSQGLRVHEVVYFVQAIGDVDPPDFSQTLKFDLHLLPSTPRSSETTENLLAIREVLSSRTPPAAGSACQYCVYAENVLRLESTSSPIR